MAAARNLIGDAGSIRPTMRDEEKAKENDSPSSKKPKLERSPSTRWEFAAAFGVFAVFSTGLFCIYLTMPTSVYVNLKLPRTISDLRFLKYAYFPPFCLLVGLFELPCLDVGRIILALIA